MNDINRLEGDNLGGIVRFKFIPVDDIRIIDDAVAGVVSVEITLQASKKWFCAYATLGTMGYTESPTNSSAGTIFSRQFSAFIPKDSAEINAQLNEMRDVRFVLDYTDSNGLRKIVGSIEEPLNFSSSLNTQSDMPGRNGHNIVFSGDATHKAYVYDI